MHARTEIQPRDIGNYVITGVIGEGGMGRVYEGRHRILGRLAAIKVLWPEHVEDRELAGRFINEARAATNIHHPGIVNVYELGHQDDGSVFIAMERLRGENLAERMQRVGSLSPMQAAVFSVQICSALQAAHNAGIVHRDLKPSNILIVADSEVPGGERTKLLDFGIAKFSDPGEAGAVATRAGAMMGTPQYMSPEQCNDASRVDPRADIYSLGCILFEMLCNRPPFRGASYIDVVSAQVSDTPPVASSLRPEVSPELDAIVARALAKNPHERFTSAREFGVELRTALGDSFPTMDMPEGAVAFQAEAPSRWRRLAGLLVGVALTSALAAGLWHFRKNLAGVIAGEPSLAAPVDAGPGPEIDAAEPVAPVWIQLEAGATSMPQAGPGETTWLLESSPPGAEVEIAGKVIGNTPMLGRVARVPEQHVVVKLTLEGYWVDPIVLSSLEDHRDEIVFSPAVAVEVRSRPSGALVHDMDGELLGKTPLEVHYRQNQHRTIIVRLDGYQEVKHEIEFERPHTERIKFRRMVSIRIESDPPGAQVWLDATMLGLTPYTGELAEQDRRFVFDIDHPRCERKQVKLSGRRDGGKHVRLTCQDPD